MSSPINTPDTSKVVETSMKKTGISERLKTAFRVRIKRLQRR